MDPDSPFMETAAFHVVATDHEKFEEELESCIGMLESERGYQVIEISHSATFDAHREKVVYSAVVWGQRVRDDDNG